MTAEHAVVRRRRVIPAPPERVYRASVFAVALLAPTGLTVTAVKVDERVGGHYRIWLAGPAGDAGSFDCELVELVADERLVVRWRSVAEEHITRPAGDSRLTIALRATSDGTTGLTLVHERLDALEPPRLRAIESPVMTRHAPRAELTENWRRYRSSGDHSSRDWLLLTYAPLIQHVAGRLRARLPSDVRMSDLVAYGMVGLIGAIDRFMPDGAIGFESYAVPRIRGAMIDELRFASKLPPGSVAVPRELLHGEMPTGLAQALARLPENERLIVTLHYYEALTFGEVGEVLGLGASRVSELHTEAMRRLQADYLPADELWSGGGGALFDTGHRGESDPGDALDVLASRIANAS